MEDNRQISQFKIFLNDRLILVTLIFSITTNAFLWWLVYSRFNNQTEFVPLHYNIYFGIDLFGPWYNILLIPLTGLLFFFINVIFSYIIYKRAKLFSYFLMIVMSLSQVILLWSAWLIVRELVT